MQSIFAHHLSSQLQWNQAQGQRKMQTPAPLPAVPLYSDARKPLIFNYLQNVIF
jgi:hypothetical protein